MRVDGFRHFGFGDFPSSLVLEVEAEDGGGGASKSSVGVLVVAFKGKRGGLLPLLGQGVVSVVDGFAHCVGPSGVAGKAPKGVGQSGPEGRAWVGAYCV